MENTILTAMFDVFDEISTWLVGAVNSVSALFYNEGAFTLLGTLAIVGLGISIVFLLINVVSNFLNLRG